jgi:hypothetical protein
MRIKGCQNKRRRKRRRWKRRGETLQKNQTKAPMPTQKASVQPPQPEQTDRRINDEQDK